MRETAKSLFWGGLIVIGLLFAALVACEPARADINPWSAEIAASGQGAQPAAGRIARHHSHRIKVKFRVRETPDAPLELHPTLSVASRYLGGRNPTGTRGKWCRDFVNFTLRKAGYRVADHSRRARDAVRLGSRVSHPQPGDIVVMRSHTTFFAGWGGRGVRGLGGNQGGGRVTVSSYPLSRVIAFVRPAG